MTDLMDSVADIMEWYEERELPLHDSMYNLLVEWYNQGVWFYNNFGKDL